MGKHLVIQYFDHYAEKEWVFNTKQEALDFVKKKEIELRNKDKTYVEYRGKTKSK